MGNLLHRIGRLLVAVVLVASGCYVFVYLARWEWNRAVMAGFFFLAAEVALIADMTLGRIRELDREVARTRDAEQVAALAARLRAARPDTPGPFAWLSRDPDRLNVFLPILIGAGVILSALSFLVEQVSRVTAVPVAEHELARGLTAMALPPAGLSPTGRLASGDPSAGLPQPASQRVRWLVFAGLAAGIAALVLVLFQLLLGVSAPADADRALQLDLVVQRRDLAQPDRDIAVALWATCLTRVPQEVELVSLEQVDPGDPAHLRMVLSPAPARTDTIELVGCIEDATVERSWTSVVGVVDVPTRS